MRCLVPIFLSFSLLVSACGPEAPQKTIYNAVASQDLVDVKRHIAAGSDLNVQGPNGDTPAHLAIKTDSLDILRALVEAGADTTKVGANDMTMLRLCFFDHPHPDAAKVLIELHAKGTDIDLWAAAEAGNAEAVSMLLEQGIDANYQRAQIDMQTPLLAAAAGGHEEVVRLLLDAGANKNVRSANPDHRQTAEQVAAGKGFAKLAEMIAAHD